MRVIIIGSKGFIGQNLFNYFLGKGNDVWGADVLADISNNKRYFQIINTSSDYNEVFKNITYDLCINCSGAASVPESLTDPSHDFNLNTLNVFRILDTIKKYQPGCRFINLSSAAVYGNPQVLPVKEDLKPNPLSPYGFHKLQAEQICREFYQSFAIPTCSLRIFSVYGPGLKKQLFWDLYKKMKTGIPFSLFGSGNESRDFIYIADLVRAIEIVSEFSDFKADTINIADGKEIYIKDAVSIFLSFFEPGIGFTFSGETRKGDPVNWVADISKLTSFGYKPIFNMTSGLEKYHEWIRESNPF